MLLLAVGLAVVGCSAPQTHEKKVALREQLIGKWENDGGWLTFTSGGLVGRYGKGEGWAATFEFVDDGRVEVGETEEGKSAIWIVEPDDDALKLTLPDGRVESYQKSAKPGEPSDPNLIGLWTSGSVGNGRENSIEFTPEGVFVAFRWITPAKGGEKYKAGEAGTFTAAGGKLTLNGARQRDFKKELQYKIEKATLEMTGMWKDKDGNPTKRTYHKR